MVHIGRPPLNRQKLGESEGVGAAGAVVAGSDAVSRRSVDGSSDGGQRGVVADSGRCGVAGSACVYGNWKTIYNRHHRWATEGAWAGVVDELRRGCDEAEGSYWTVAVDGTVVRAHQHAAGPDHTLASPHGASVLELTRHGAVSARSNDKNPAEVPRRSLHRRWHDSTAFTAVKGRYPGAVAPAEVGHRPPPGSLLGDKAFSNQDHPWTVPFVDSAVGVGSPRQFPEKTDQIGHRAQRGSRGGGPPAFDPSATGSATLLSACQQARGFPGRGHPLGQV